MCAFQASGWTSGQAGVRNACHCLGEEASVSHLAVDSPLGSGCRVARSPSESYWLLNVLENISSYHLIVLIHGQNFSSSSSPLSHELLQYDFFFSSSYKKVESTSLPINVV